MMRVKAIQPVGGVTAGSIAKYMLLPGILPRLRNLSHTLQHVFFTFLKVFGAIGLIDPHHPCMQEENLGRYGFADMILLAWQNVRFNRNGLPQAVMFFAVLAAIVLTAAIIAGAGLYLFSSLGGAAHAQYFGDPATAVPYEKGNDWAFQFLERIFGGKPMTGLDFWVPEQYEGATAQGGNRWYTSLLIGMLVTYSKALMILAVFMIVYLVTVALVDAARTGKPFGEKFDPVWAPIRFALAFAMLAPVAGSGYNGAQLIVFQTAQWGSSLGTNLWHRGIEATDSMTPDNKNFVSGAVADRGYKFLRDMFMINLCVVGYKTLLDQGKVTNLNGSIVDPPFISTGSKTTTISFGTNEAADFCGTYTVPTVPLVPLQYLSSSSAKPTATRTADNFLPAILAQKYQSAAANFMPPASDMQEVSMKMVKGAFCDRNQNYMDLECDKGKCYTQVTQWIYKYWRMALGRDVSDPDKDHFLAMYENDIKNYNSWISDSLRDDAKYGWASAGAFYLRMSYALSMISDAINSQPRVTKLPANVYRMYATPKSNKPNSEVDSTCTIKTANQSECLKFYGSLAMNELLEKGRKFFVDAPKLQDMEEKTGDVGHYQKLGAHIFDAELLMAGQEQSKGAQIDSVMGPLTSRLYDMFELDDKNLNPLGQVIGWGNGFLDISKWAFGISLALSVASTILTYLFPAAAGAAAALAQMSNTIGMWFIVPGFVLMFVVPLLPFLYFTFAVVEWVASVIEAVIGMPLWALSFLTREGDFTGKALEGVKTLFEIVIRPPVIVMSLVASLLIFTAAVKFFNDSIRLYINAFDNGVKGAPIIAVAGIGMVFVYMIGIYSLATSCFKMADVIPNHFGRWLGLRGGIFKMDAKGVAFASAVVAKRGASIVMGTANTANAAVRDEAEARKRKADYDKWLAAERLRIQKENEETMRYNQSLREKNAILALHGYAAEPEKPLQRMPEARNLSYFRDLVIAQRKADLTTNKGSAYAMPLAAAMMGAASGPRNSTGGSGGWNSSSSGPANQPFTYTTRGSTNPNPSYNYSTANNASEANEGKTDGFKGHSGKMYKVSEVERAFKALGLPLNSSPQAILKKYNEMAKKFHPDTLGKNEGYDKIQEAFKILKDVYDVG